MVMRELESVAVKQFLSESFAPGVFRLGNRAVIVSLLHTRIYFLGKYLENSRIR